MTAVTVPESGMTFGPFEAEDLFEVEKCAAVRKLGSGLKVAEFAWRRPSVAPAQVWIVEAKSSAPKDVALFVRGIRDKLVNSLSLLLAARVGRLPAVHAQLPASFPPLDVATLAFRLVLVVRGHKAEWLPPLQDALRASLAPTVRTWGLAPHAVVVLNEALAQRHGLVSPPP